VKAATAFIAS